MINCLLVAKQLKNIKFLFFIKDIIIYIHNNTKTANKNPQKQLVEYNNSVLAFKDNK